LFFQEEGAVDSESLTFPPTPPFNLKLGHKMRFIMADFPSGIFLPTGPQPKLPRKSQGFRREVMLLASGELQAGSQKSIMKTKASLISSPPSVQ